MSVVAIAILLCVSALSISVSSDPSAKCLHCMCQAYGCNDACQGGACGYYRIMWKYYVDCYKPGVSYYACVHNMACSQKCVIAYMNRHVDPPQSCEQCARTHMGGPNGRYTWAATNYWHKVKACCDQMGGC